MQLSHRERLQATLAGQPVDRPPVALWRHFPVDDQDPVRLANAALLFQETYDFDLIKVTPASSFCLKDWGVEDEWMGDSEGTRQYTRRVIERPQDWEALPVLSPDSSHLTEQLRCLRYIRSAVGQDTPVIQTIFSPLSQAKNLAGQKTLFNHLRKYPQAVLQGLDTIARSTENFIDAATYQGIDGFFYAVQHAQSGLLSRDEYLHFGYTSDRELLSRARELWLNIVHIHGDNIYFDLFADFPAQVLNWHDRDTPPSLREIANDPQLAQSSDMSFCGGLSRELLVLGTPESIRQQAQDALATARSRFILGTGCVVPITAPHGNIRAAREAVEVEE